MAGYVLFIKGANSATAAAQLEPLGLGDLGAGDLMATSVDSGPNQTHESGAIVGWLKGDGSDPKLQIHPEQTWIPLPAKGSRKKEDVWLGYEKNRPVSPSDLARRELMPGNLVRLRDLNDWLIPAAQQLPRTFGLGDDGQVTREVEPRFRAYFDRAFSAVQEVFRPFGIWNDENGFKDDIEPNDEIKTVTIQDGTKLACEALSINYRLNYEIALMLGLLDDKSLVGVIACTFDMPEIFAVEQQKKKEEVVSIPVTSLT